MVSRFAVVVCLCCAVPLAAQSSASRSNAAAPHAPSTRHQDLRVAWVNVRASARGNVSISAHLKPAFGDEAPNVLAAIPSALECDWVPVTHDDSSTNGLCRAWLTKKHPALRLAPLVQRLYALGADKVWIYVDAARATSPAPPEGWKAENTRSGKLAYFTFESAGAADLPADVPLSIDGPLDYSRIFTPVVVILLAPGLVAFAVRSRAMHAEAGRKVNWIVWLNWINLCSWLYWISAVDLGDLGEMLQLLGSSNILIPLALGVAIYALPPLLALTACMGAMQPLISSSSASFQLLLKRRLAGEATFLVPLGIFLVSAEFTSSSLGYGSATLGVVIAYTVYRALAWFTWTLSYSETKAVESGVLIDRARALARKAGVTLAGLNLLRTRVPEEANAFASSGNRITLTESLVNGLTPREVDAVIAHELGHHKAGHTRVNYGQLVFIAYIVVAGPLFGWLISRYHLPQWFVTLPITPLLFTVLQGVLSQRREFAADARAVEITGDPEGSIAALARLAQLSRVPVQSQGIMGSILSHPSMEKRVLTLARRNSIPGARALEILRDPDVAYSGAQARAFTPPPLPSWTAGDPMQHHVHKTAETPQDLDPVFSLRAKMALQEQLRWLRLISPLAGACLLSIPFVYLPVHPTAVASRWLLLLAAIPIFMFEIVCEYAVLRRFALRIRRHIARSIPARADAIFAGIHPGSGVRFTEGLSEWDFGFITLEGDWLCYRGEKTRFSIARQEVKQIHIVKGRKTWLRERRVEIASVHGSFTLNTNFAYSTMAETERTARRLCKWASCRGFSAGVASEPPPALPALPGAESSRLGAIWLFLKITFQLWIASTLLVMIGTRHGPFTAVAAIGICMLSAPLAVFVRLFPGMVWPVRRPQSDDPVMLPVPVPSGATAGMRIEP